MQRVLSIRFRVLCLLSLVILVPVGCQQQPQNADAARSRDALNKALESWKNGDQPQKLKAELQPIYCNDEDWAAGLQLRSYKIADTDDYSGRSCRIVAQLELANGQGTPVQKKIVYVIDTAAAVVIVRER